jgi:hypothetical protein
MNSEDRDKVREHMHKVEESAMRKDEAAILLLISLEKALCAGIERMLDKRYRDGECDGYTLTEFETTYEEAITDCNLDKDDYDAEMAYYWGV